MAAADLGQRHRCSACQRKFYDLGRADATCPRCGGAPEVRPLRLRVVTPAPAQPELDDGAADMDAALAGLSMLDESSDPPMDDDD